MAHGDGSFARRLAQVAKLDLSVIDDFAMTPLGTAERDDTLELLDDRIETRSTLTPSPLPVRAWRLCLGDRTLADAILDRIVHSSHRIALKSRSLRESEATPTTKARATMKRWTGPAGAPPAAWQGVKLKTNLQPQNTLDQAPKAARFSLIVDDCAMFNAELVRLPSASPTVSPSAIRLK